MSDKNKLASSDISAIDQAIAAANARKNAKAAGGTPSAPACPTRTRQPGSRPERRNERPARRSVRRLEPKSSLPVSPTAPRRT